VDQNTEGWTQKERDKADGEECKSVVAKDDGRCGGDDQIADTEDGLQDQRELMAARLA